MILNLRQLVASLRMLLVLTVLLGRRSTRPRCGASAGSPSPTRPMGPWSAATASVVGSSLLGQDFTGRRAASTAARQPASMPAASVAVRTSPPAPRTRSRRWPGALRGIRRNEFRGAAPADALTASASGLDPHISPGERPRPGRPGGRRQRPRACRGAGAGGRPHPGAVARVPGRTAGQRARAQPRGAGRGQPDERARPRRVPTRGDNRLMSRGVLRVYLGAAPGVGKTVAMLSEARRRRERGTDVVIGVCETHGRAYTAGHDGRTRAGPPARGRPTAARPRRSSTSRRSWRAPRGRPGRRARPHQRPREPSTPSAGRTSRTCSSPGSTSSRRSTSSTSSRSTTWSRRSPGCASRRPCPTRWSGPPTRSSSSTCRPRRCAAGSRTATCMPRSRSTPPSPTTSARATCPPCASCPCCGSPTGSRRGWTATGPTTRSPSCGRPGSGWSSP